MLNPTPSSSTPSNSTPSNSTPHGFTPQGGAPQNQHPQGSLPPNAAPFSTTPPIWRFVGVACLFGAIAALGKYFDAAGHVNEFATVTVITIGFTISFWAHKRPDRVRTKFGPFGKIAEAIRDSIDDIRQWTYDRPLRVGALLAVGYGIAVVAAKSLLVFILSSLYSWQLAVAVGLAVGAVVAAPGMFTTALRKMTGPHQGNHDDTPEPPNERNNPY